MQWGGEARAAQAQELKCSSQPDGGGPFSSTPGSVNATSSAKESQERLSSEVLAAMCKADWIE